MVEMIPAVVAALVGGVGSILFLVLTDHFKRPRAVRKPVRITEDRIERKSLR